jgi:hypothetical protein
MKNKVLFWIKNKSRITMGAFNNFEFLHNKDIELFEKKIPVESFKDYFCPWYYVDNKFVSLADALKDNKAQAIKVSDQKIIDSDKIRKKQIEKYQNQDINYFKPIILATDSDSHKTLILDGNKTAVSLYRNYLKDHNNVKINSVEIIGHNLPDLTNDFIILNRK